jgi:hypothetical protein
VLRVIENLPLHVTGIHAYYEVSEQEYVDVLSRMLKSNLQNYRKINFILVLETEIKNFASGLWCGNVRIGVKYFFRWNKVAIVSDQKGLRGYSDLFKYIIPGKFKNFPLANMGDAIIWASKK